MRLSKEQCQQISDLAMAEAARIHREAKRGSKIKFSKGGEKLAIRSAHQWLLRKDNPWYLAMAGPWGVFGNFRDIFFAA